MGIRNVDSHYIRAILLQTDPVFVTGCKKEGKRSIIRPTKTKIRLNGTGKYTVHLKGADPLRTGPSYFSSWSYRTGKRI